MLLWGIEFTFRWFIVMWCSVTKSCPTLCNPVDCSVPAVPVLHCPLEFAQTHVHWVSWYHPTISSSVNPLSCLQSFGSFPVSRLFASGAQSIGSSASVVLMNIQGWFPLGLTGLISLQSKGLSRVFSSTTIWKAWGLRHSTFFMDQISYPYMTTENTTALTIQTFGKMMISAF